MLSKLGLNTRAPYHLMIYSIAFGGSAFYSFFASPIAFKVLKREEFGVLQNSVFPYYFLGQTIAPGLLALTTPLTLCPFTSTLLVLSTVSSAINLFYLLPVCKDIKEKRLKLIEVGLDSIDGEPTEDFKKLTKSFGIHHGLSLLANFTSIVTLGVYGLVLSKRLI
ncbi:hypothetical protein PSN45_000120 [Yamadazyma tenuis]|uniref:TMEM205-like domain-containing protein n=1 Tax=Candida tenuis (strain ATCC 10573 / BCRC 21748 / CBS 615 / JCM 9827 / NBRC 10315 / NRRL Y-1498 / VKM Y-70) TaxID=590646 RepID=G3BAN4_CANTC|nr:uncharacterized protein CANTEDRAFT_109025 [Yamadazyma tenuis ATCC 10573]EGV61452.1 hypothetical protein CANTEDRAFT_109025 [Yamadazyma tenuis ATCC 10573]WEJ92665.1 hypothetical protein PSN45_000120 [Yamadazyma tenuis]